MLKQNSLILILILLVTVSTAVSQTNGEKSDEKANQIVIDKQFINPSEMPKAPGYSQAVAVTGGRTVYLSGQVAFNAKGELIGKGDLRAQTRQVFENIKTVLAASNASFTDVVKISYYVKDYKPELVTIIRDIRNQYLSKGQPPPASTLIGVQSLFQDDVLIEIEAIAVVQ